MPERPIILFGTPIPSSKSKRTGGSSPIQLPTHSRQIERLTPKMTSLQNTLLTLQQTSTGIEAERTLVFEVAKSTDDFYTAIKNMGSQAEWIFDVPEEISASDDFHEYKEDRHTKERTRSEDKTIVSGKVYCVLTNARALQELFQLWEHFQHNPDTKFPQGKAGLRNVFKCLVDVHIWGYKERIEETGILEAWKEDLQYPDLGNVKCEIELFFRKSADLRQQREDDLVAKIHGLGGSVLKHSTIEEIAYHAVLADLPREAVERIMQNDTSISLLAAEQIMFFRPVGQAVYISGGDDLAQPLNLPNTDDIIDEPIIALFDGLPQENHPFLGDRIIVEDPEGYASQYTVLDRKHGTSMASLIALGDLSGAIRETSHKIYVRPIMKSKQGLHNTYEEVPNDILLVDKIHEAVRRLYVAEAGAVAPTVRVINLSIAIKYRQFDRSMSPLARLLDWLSYEYRVLFVVSAGNHGENIDAGMAFRDFSALNMAERDARIVEFVNNNGRNRRLLSPSESMNALTVGATFDDNTTFTHNARFVLPCSDGMLSPISAVGKGLNNSVKPDVVYPGGKNLISDCPKHPGTFRWRDIPSQREPGIVSAAPFVPGSNTKVAYSFGTSNSTALISHEASRCYDALVEVFEHAGSTLPDDYMALLIKAMLVHGAEWGTLKDTIIQSLGLTSRKEYSDVIHRFIGYGKPDVDRAIECAKNRITLIGYDILNDGKAHLYKLPLPFDFNREKIIRRLTATLTCFVPIVPTRQAYRSAHLWFTVEGAKERLIDNRVDVDWQAALRGAVQHEIFENEEIIAWGEDDFIQIKVNCRATTGNHLAAAIPYALMVSFEIKGDIDVDVYTKVADKIRPRVTA